MKRNYRQGHAYAWEVLYEQAISEPNPAIRRMRLFEAQEAILDRARMLDDEPGQEHESEVYALEEAADFVREMKLESQADGAGKEVKIGDQERLSGKGQSSRDAAHTKGD
jgi:hypothetical protein